MRRLRKVIATVKGYAKAQGELALSPRTWGGMRPGAGRKKKLGKREPAHRTRPEHKERHPVHVVMRARQEVGRLRHRKVYKAVRRAWQRCANAAEFRIVHTSIQHNHLHLLVEAKTKAALTLGMRTLTVNLAKAINRDLGRRGKVFAFRYHATAITTPRQARNALAYVLNNWRHHREDQTTPGAATMRIDPFSTGIVFDGWKRIGKFGVPADYEPLPAAEASTWLLRVGWRKHGEIDVREVPGPLH